MDYIPLKTFVPTPINLTPTPNTYFDQPSKNYDKNLGQWYEDYRHDLYKRE